jgi:ectoine hydroxylase-related dioxygenase (phytanoyl-CoA dioxygenase family)
MPKLHALNRDFAWRPSATPLTVLTPAQAAQYDRDGFFLFERAFTPAEVEAVIAAIDPFEAEGERWLREQPDGKFLIAKADAITFTVHLVAKSEPLARFSRHPVLAAIARDTLGPKPRLYWDQAVYKKPGNPEEFPWHQDNGYTYIEPQQYLTCWIPLTDATVENGCPWVVPGLHALGTLAHEATPLGWQCLSNPEGAIPVEAKAGDIVVFSSLTPHRTGPNLTTATRKAYILQYAPDGARAYPGGGDNAVPQDDTARQYLV